jgi:hypothetical protein
MELQERFGGETPGKGTTCKSQTSSSKSVGVVWTVLIWLRIGRGGWLL